MRRREFFSLIGSAALGAKAIAANAQARSLPVIGVLTPAKLPDWAANGLYTGLKEAGYDEGLSLNVVLRSAEGHFDRLPALASELVESQVTVILATGSPVPARAAKAATSTIPIVFAYGGDPVADGLVESLNRPGANVTGATFIGTALLAKRIELLHEILPETSDFALLVNPKGTLSEPQINDAKVASGKLGLHLHVVSMSTESDIEAGFETMAQLKVGGFIVSTDPFFSFIGGDRLVKLAQRYKLPAIYNTREEPGAGGLISYGPNKADTWRQAALYVGRILKGEKPSNLPILQPTNFDMVVNLKTAKELGMTIPPTLIGLADEVIE